LHFCSFQASLDQFDVVFNDWMLNRQFPPQHGGADAGVDALLDPARQLTVIEKVGFFFVPPYNERGLAAAIFATHEDHRRANGRLVVHKRAVDPNDASRHFERRGFTFQIVDGEGQPLANSQFSTDSTGRGICPVELEIGQQYTPSRADFAGRERSAGEYAVHHGECEPAAARDESSDAAGYALFAGSGRLTASAARRSWRASEPRRAFYGSTSWSATRNLNEPSPARRYRVPIKGGRSAAPASAK
jgi:hypothetical protein